MKTMQQCFILLILFSFLMACGSEKEENNETTETTSEQESASEEENQEIEEEENDEETSDTDENEEAEDPMTFFYGPWEVEEVTSPNEDDDMGFSMSLATENGATYYFDIDGSYNMTSSPDFDVTDNGTWKMSEDRKTLTLSNRESGISDMVLEIETFTAKQIIAKLDYPYADKTFPTKMVFKAKPMD